MARVISTTAALITFSYWSKKDGKDREVTFVVPSYLLWEADGLRQVFTATRESFLIGPEEDADAYEEDIWESWHLFACKENTDIRVLEGDWIDKARLSEGAGCR